MTSSHDDRNLMLYAHGELSPLERLRVTFHIHHCPACRRRWEDFVADAATFRNALAPSPVSAPGTRFAATVAARVRQVPQDGRPPSPRLAPRPTHGRSGAGLWILTVAIVVLLLASAGLLRARYPRHPRVTAPAAQPGPGLTDCGRPPSTSNTPPGGTVLQQNGNLSRPAR